MCECSTEMSTFLLWASMSSSVKSESLKHSHTRLLTVLNKIMYAKYLALGQAHSTCSINVRPYSFLLLRCLQSPTIQDSWKLPLQVRSKHYLWEEKLSRQKKGSQTKLLTGMCTVALYWFYIRVSLRILSGACKCEIGKRHCRNATSHHTGRVKGKAEGMGVGQGKGAERRKAER